MFDYATLKLIWWVLVGVLLLGFAIMDGHDMGVGSLLPFIGKTDDERRAIINSVGPHWEGNQVWFVTAGGAIFAAWPLVYATAFSGFFVYAVISYDGIVSLGIVTVNINTVKDTNQFPEIVAEHTVKTVTEPGIEYFVCISRADCCDFVCAFDGTLHKVYTVVIIKERICFRRNSENFIEKLFAVHSLILNIMNGKYCANVLIAFSL